MDLFSGPGEAAALMRARDWAATPLGLPETWPHALQTLVPIMLASRFAMRVLWGPELILLYNDSYRPVLGASKHPAAMGRRTQDSFAELWHVVGPLFERVMRGEAIALDDTQLPLERYGYLEECFFTLSYSPIQDGDTIGGVLGVVYETTERVLAERRLRTLRDLTGVTPASSAGLACKASAAALARNPFDLPFALLYLADAAGPQLMEAIGLPETSPLVAATAWPLDGERHIVALADEVRAGPYPEAVRQAVVIPLRRPGQPESTAYLIVGVNPRRALDATYEAFLDLSGEQIATSLTTAIVENERNLLIAAAVDARAEAERSNLAKDEFLAIVSHELRNPLSAMLGWTRLLRTADLSEAKRAQALETIERNAVNQSQLIEDLLDVSRIVTGKLKLEVQPINFVEILRAAIASARPAIDAKQLRVRTVFDDTSVSLMGDAARLQQVVWNLLTNAIKFTAKGGSISLLLTRIDSTLELAVTDSGSGISAELLPLVFERFKQADSSTTRMHGGLGLGLAITKSIVEMHGGTVGARSDGEGHGSTFVIRLPVAPMRVARGSAVRPPPAWDVPPELARLHVLVVDDDRDGREMIGMVLEQCGTRVTLAGSVREALAAFALDRPDVVLSDIGMPGEDGYELIRQIRALGAEAGGTVPAASLTAYAGVEDRRRALLAGFNMHVPKPVDPAELVAVIGSLGRFAHALR